MKSTRQTLSLIGLLYHRAAVTSVAVVVLGAALCTPAIAQLFQNGDFESGNSSFGSDLGFVPSAPIGINQNGVYAVATNPAAWYPFGAGWASMGDHTTGSGNMLLATPNPGTARIWYESVNVSAGTIYTFNGCVARIANFDPNMADLSFNAGAASLGTFDLSSLSEATWGKFSFNYTAASTGPVVFSITDLAASSDGNDFALDDLSLVPVPEPGSIALFALGAVLMIARRRKQDYGPGCH